MKKIIYILPLLFLSLFSKAQNPIPADSAFTIKQSLGNATNTIVVSNVMQPKGGFVNGTFFDTTAANRTKLKFYPGAQIFATSDNLMWYRNATATQWVHMGTGSQSSTVNIIDAHHIEICTGNGSCDTVTTSVVANYIHIENDSTLIVCDSTNVCQTININPTHFTNPNLQQVTNVGNTTTNQIYIYNGFGNNGGGYPMEINGDQNRLLQYEVKNYSDGVSSASGFVANNKVFGHQLALGIGNSNHALYPDRSFINANGLNGLNIESDSGRILIKEEGATKITIGSNATQIGATRFEESKGASVAAANNLTLGTDGNVFSITGATQINAITTSNWQAGSVIYLKFASTPTVKNAVSGGAGTAQIILAGGIDFVAATNDVLTLMFDGSVWNETARKVAATGGTNVYTASNLAGLGVGVYKTTVANDFQFKRIKQGTGITVTDGTDSITIASTTSGISHAVGQNGLNNFNDSTIELGGTLLQNTSIVNADKTLTITGNTIAGNPILSITSTSTAAASNLQKVLNIDLSGANSNSGQVTYGSYISNTHTGTNSTNYGGYFTASGGSTANYAVYGNGGDYGGYFTGTSLAGVAGVSNGSFGGVYGQSTSAMAGFFNVLPTSTNTVVQVLRVQRGTTGTSADGIGGSIDFYNQTTDFNGNLSNQLISKYTTDNTATRVSEFSITGVNSASTATLFTISGAGGVRFNTYGAGALSTDGSGNITATSDVRLKDVKGNYKAGLKEILNLHPIVYRWNKLSGYDMTDTYAGFSAQEVKRVLPYSTGQMKNGYLTLQDRSIIAALVNSVQELQKEIDDLKKKK